MPEPDQPESGATSPAIPARPRHLARLTLLSFLLTFTAARILVFLIMDWRIPDLFLHVGGTHVHHLNYGIFLLAALSGYLLFVPRTRRGNNVAAVAYGLGLALTFDEFGMWVHLGGGYWQRASFDAVSAVAAILGLIAFAPPPQRWRPKHWIAAGAALVLVIVFFGMLVRTYRYAGERLGPRLERLEQRGPA